MTTSISTPTGNVVEIKADLRLAQQRINAQFASEQRLAHKIATNAHRKHELAKQTKLTGRIRTNMAIRQIRLVLLRRAQLPNSLFLTLCTHPCFPLVYRQHPKHKDMETLAALISGLHGRTPQLRSLAQALSTALPELAACFENGLCLQQVWLAAAQQLIEHPLDGNPLEHLPASQLYQFSVVEHPTLDAKPVFAALNIEQRAAFCRYGQISYSWFCFLDWLHKKCLPLKAALNISKAKSRINQ